MCSVQYLECAVQWEEPGHSRAVTGNRARVTPTLTASVASVNSVTPTLTASVHCNTSNLVQSTVKCNGVECSEVK